MDDSKDLQCTCLTLEGGMCIGCKNKKIQELELVIDSTPQKYEAYSVMQARITELESLVGECGDYISSVLDDWALSPWTEDKIDALLRRIDNAR